MVTHCPVCQQTLDVIKLKCPSCGTTIEGRFSGCKFCELAPEDRLFLEVFVSSRGNIKEVEKKMGISYPTVRGKLEALIEKLGYSPKKEKASNVNDRRFKVLEDLEKGKIDTNKALGELKKLKESEE